MGSRGGGERAAGEAADIAAKRAREPPRSMRGARGVGFAQSIVQHAANAVEMSAAERISALARHVGDRLDDRTGRRDEVGRRERVDSRRRVVVGGQLGAAREPRDCGAVGLC